ncbi:Elongation factor 2 [uncultured archaeon]|nr:Elongation factor 2 [uncultured archaeon]
MQGRRGQVSDIQQNETGEVVTVLAKMPVAETFGLANDFRSATQGRAIWYPEFAGYEKIPTDLQNKIVPEIRARKGDKKEIPTPQDFLE